MAAVHEVHEIVRRAEARGGREVAGDLVAPRAGKRMLHDGQQLDVRVAHPLHVFDQVDGQFAIAQELPLRPAHPGFQVHFVDRDRRLQPVGAAARFHPVGVVPLVFVDIPDHRGRFRRHLAVEGVRIGLELLVGGEARAHVVLVRGALAQPGDEDLPDAAIAPAHGMAAGVPLVELAGHRDALGVGRPDGEAHALHAIDLGEVRAQRAIGFVVRAFGVQVQLEFGDQRPKR